MAEVGQSKSGSTPDSHFLQSNMAKVIAVNKVNGIVVNLNDIVDELKMWIATSTNGSYKLTFEKAKVRRSINQNNLMWLWFTAIADKWGDAYGHSFTPKNVHDSFCEAFLPVDTPLGVVGGSTSILTKEQATEFMNNIQSTAASEWGITLPTPEDRFFDEWASDYEDKAKSYYGK